MSMELTILSSKTLSKIDDWQRAIDAHAFDLKLPTNRPLPDIRGELPITFASKRTTFLYDPVRVTDVRADWPGLRFDRTWAHAIILRWGADIDAGAAAYAAGASYAAAVGGRLLDAEEGKIITPQRGFKIARELGRSRSQIDDVVRLITEMYRKD